MTAAFKGELIQLGILAKKEGGPSKQLVTEKIASYRFAYMNVALVTRSKQASKQARKQETSGGQDRGFY